MKIGVRIYFKNIFCHIKTIEIFITGLIEKLPIIVVFSLPLNTTLIDFGANIIFCINSTYFTKAAVAARQ